MKWQRWLFLGLAFCSIGRAEDSSGLQVSASVESVGQAGIAGNSEANNKLIIRTGEFMLAAPADHLFDGTLSFAAHDENEGIPVPELHEAWIGSTKLIPRSRFRLGQFFLGIGRLNQFHLHDWPFITAPRVQREFLAFEGVIDTGFEFSYLLPLPFFLELTLGLTNGYTFGHDHTAGQKPKLPTHYARAVTFKELPGDGGAQIGVSYVGRRSDADQRLTLVGLDFTAKWKEAKVTDLLIQSEVWHRTQQSEAALGFYVYPQKYLGENLFLGIRADYFSILNNGVKNFDVKLVPTLSYQSSEFAQFRIAYNFKTDYFRDHFNPSSHMIEGQAIFILGAHPAHDF